MDYIKAFIIGGIICALTQILLDRTKLMPGRIMVLLVCSGAVLGAIGIYQPFQDFAGAGASVPLCGFGNLPGRIQSQCSRYQRSINIRISRIIDIQS